MNEKIPHRANEENKKDWVTPVLIPLELSETESNFADQDAEADFKTPS